MSIRVTPNTDGFRRELQRELDAAEAGLEVTIPVEFDVDTAVLRAEIQALDNSRVTIPVDIGDGSEIERLRTRLEALDNARLTVPLEIGDGTEVERLRAQLAALDNERVRLDVSVTGAAEAAAELRVIDQLVDRLDGRNVRIHLDIDGLTAAVAQLAAMQAILALLPSGGPGGGLRGLSLGFSGLAGGIAGAAQLAISLGTALAKASAVATAVAVGGAAITAAFGLAATAIAVLPAAIALIGAPLGLLLLDMDALGKKVKELTPAFQAFRTEATNALAKGLAPALETLANSVLPKVKGELLGVATTMGQVAQKAAEWAATGPGIDLINGILANVNRTIQTMLPGLGDIGIAFLELANQGAAFDVLSGAVNAFGESFRANVEALIGSGKMQAAFQGLGDTLQIAARGFADLVHNGILLFAAAAPGVNALLGSLVGFFNRFDWTSLGTSVGGVFQGLADAINSVPQGTIDAIEASFARLAQTFQSADFQAQIQTMIAGIPSAIDLVNQLVQAFGTIGAGVSIAIQAFQRIGQAVTGFAQVMQGAAITIMQFGRMIGNPWQAWLDRADIGAQFDRAGELVRTGVDKLGHAFTDPWPTIGTNAVAAASSATGQIPEAVLAPLRGVPGAINTLNPAIAAAVTSLGGQSANAAERAMQGVPPAVIAPLTPIPGQVGTALAPAEQAAQTATTNIGNVLQAGAAQWGPQVDAGLAGISTSFQTGSAQWSTTIGTAITSVSVAITTGLAGASAAATTGMTGVTTAIAVGTANWYVAVSQGMTVLQTTVTLGFTNLTTAATTGMTSVQTAITTGAAQWATAITVGMAALSLQVASGFQLMAAVAIGGMVAVTASITSGFAGVNAAITAGMAAAVAAVTSGMAAIQAAFVVNWAGVTAATTAAMAAMVAAMTAGMAAMVATSQQGWQLMTTAAQQGAQRMTDALTNGMNQSVAVVTSGISRMVSALNSAVGQFRAAGANMGQALADGLNSKAGAVEAAAQRLANAAAAAVRAAAGIHSPSRVFMNLGDMMGAGLELGLHDARTGIISEARGIVDDLQGEFRAADSKFGSQLDARVRASIADTSSGSSDTSGVLRELRVQTEFLATELAEIRGLRRDGKTTPREPVDVTASRARHIAAIGAF